MMGVIEWRFHRGEPTLWRPTPKHSVPPQDLAALIVDSSDNQHRKMAKVFELESGSVEMVENNGSSRTLYGEDCFILHLAFPDGDNGIWAIPFANSKSPFPYHPSPVLYFRHTEGVNSAKAFMEQQARGFVHLKDRYHSLRNGSANFADEYRILFREDAPKTDPSNF